MIELSQIQNTSKLKELRGQINTMVDEINGNQMVVGQVLNPSATIYNENSDIAGTVTASQWSVNQAFALCMPESNGVYVAQVFGILSANTTFTKDGRILGVIINIPAVKLPNREAEVNRFVRPEHLGFTPIDEMVPNTGLVFGVVAKGPNGSYSAATDITLCDDSPSTPLNLQRLAVNPNGGLNVSLEYTTMYIPKS